MHEKKILPDSDPMNTPRPVLLPGCSAFADAACCLPEAGTVDPSAGDKNGVIMIMRQALARDRDTGAADEVQGALSGLGVWHTVRDAGMEGGRCGLRC